MEAILAPKRLPQRVQNGAKNGSKSNTKFNIKYEGFQEPLGSVLGLSWVVWESILGSNIIKIHWFLKVFVKITFLKKIELEKASWTELGPILTPKRLPKGSQIGAKMEPKWHRKTIKTYDRFLDRFWIEKRASTLGQRSNNYPSRSRGGGRGRHKSLPLGTWIRI